MNVYLASPGNQMQAAAAAGMPCLISFASFCPWMDSYIPSFDGLLIDSGAFSEFNTGKAIDGEAYKDWSSRWHGIADAVAGLDDISGDVARSLKNYEKYGGFPTFHETDPPEALPELLALSKERGRWLGLGLVPPRHGKERWVRATCEQIPDGIHVHGWALREYTYIRRLDSVDSTNWWRRHLQYAKAFPWLTPFECMEIVVKRYKRWNRTTHEVEATLFDGIESAAEVRKAVTG